MAARMRRRVPRKEMVRRARVSVMEERHVSMPIGGGAITDGHIAMRTSRCIRGGGLG